MSAVVKAVKSVVNTAVSVVKKVVTTVVDTVKAAVKDPITTIAKVAAYATGNAWAIPLIDGASTLAKGGSIGDALKSAAISYGTQAIAVKVGTPIGNAAGEYAASTFGAEAATKTLVTNIVTRAAGNAAVAVITKQDPVKAFIAGGVSAASSAVLGKIPGFTDQPKWVQNTVATSVGAAVAGQQGFDEAAASILVSTSGIVADALKMYDPDGTKLTDGQRAIASDAIFKTTSAALTGRSATAALSQSLTNAAAQALGEYAKDTIKTATTGMAESYARVNGYGEQLDAIATKSKTATDKFNDVNGSLDAAIKEQNRLYQAQVDARATYDKSVTDANYTAAEKAVKEYNDYTTALNKSYNEYYKPTLDALSEEVNGYQTEYEKITGLSTSEQATLKKQIDNLTTTLDPVYASSNRAFAESLMPGFDAAAYKALNPNLPAGADPYLHYITTGQFEGYKGTQAQLKESTDILNSILTGPNVDERALQSYIDSGYLTKDFVEAASKKNYNDLVNELDKRVTTEAEAKDFFKQVYGREATSDADLAVVQEFTDLAEISAQRSLYAAKQIEDDNAEFVYNGSGAKSQADAQAQAKAKGYNTYSFGGRTYTMLPQEELNQRVELGKQILASQGKNLATASDQEIDRAMELVNNVPQAALKGASAQDILNGNYSGWRDGKYYEYAGDRLQAVYAIDPTTGKYTLEKVEIRGVGSDGSGGTPEVVVTASRDLSDMATADPAGYLELAKSLDDSAKNELGDFFTNSLNAAMLAAESTGNKELAGNIRQTFSIVTQGLGEQTENLAKFFASVTGGSYDTSLIRAAKALQTWGAANQSASTKAQEDAIKDAVSKAEGVSGKIGAFLTAAKDNPGGFFTMVAKEGVQEVLPLWAARGVMTLGKVAAYGANAALEGMESWGSSSGEVYDAAIKSGKNEYEARDMALKAGFQSAAITAVTTGVTDIPMVKKVLGEGTTASFKDIGKATAASTMGEYVEELFQNANNQRITTGSINWDYATTAATIAAGTAAGTTGAIMTGLNIRDTAFVAKDADGNNVTMADFLAGTKKVDMSTVNMNAVVGTSADGDNITLGGVAAMQMSSGVSYDTFKTGIPAAIANQNFVLGTNALGDQVTLSQAMSQVTSTNGFDKVYNNLLNTTAEQRVQAQTDYLKTTLTNAGYKPSDAEIKTLVQNTPPGSAALTTAAQQYADTHTVTEAEATKALKDAYTAAGFKDYTPTKEQVASYVQSGASIDQTAVINNIKAYVNENSVTYDEAKKMLTDRGYNPSDAEIKRFVATTNQQAQLDAVAQYVDPRQVTYDEAAAMLKKMGYNASEAEVKQFMGQKNDAAYQAAQETAVGAYVDPRMVDTGEVEAAYAALGLKKPTAEDVQKLVGQYSETDLAGKAKENLDPARYNSIMAQLEGLTTGASQETLDAIALVKKDLNAQIVSLGGDITKLSGDVATAKEELTKAIADAQSGNITRFDAIDKSIQALKDAGLTTEQVQKIVDDSSAGVSKEFKDALAEATKGNAEALATVKTGLETKISDVQTALETKLGDQTDAFNQKVQDLMDQGKTYQEATETALTDLGVKIDDLGTDFATKLGDVSTGLTDKIAATQTALEAAIADAKAAGLEGDAALQKAIDTVAADLGTTKSDLLTQLGTTEANLKSEFATQLGLISTDVQAKFDTLTESQKALALQLQQQGVDLNTAITQATTAISTDLQTKYDSLTEGQKALALQLQQQGVDFNTAMETAKAEITGAFENVSGQISDLSADVQTKYDSLTQGQKDLATQLTQQGVDFQTAMDIARTQTTEAFTNVFDTMASNQAATQKAINDAAAATQAKAAAEAEATRQAAARNAANQARLGNMNTLMTMLGQAQDTGGQQVTVKAADPAKIGYIYDWNSIFANPSQEKMFASPYGGYAQGGVVRDELDEVNDELLKILRG